jgi:hypothetical protein
VVSFRRLNIETSSSEYFISDIMRIMPIINILNRIKARAVLILVLRRIFTNLSMKGSRAPDTKTISFPVHDPLLETIGVNKTRGIIYFSYRHREKMRIYLPLINSFKS